MNALLSLEKKKVINYHQATISMKLIKFSVVHSYHESMKGGRQLWEGVNIAAKKLNIYIPQGEPAARSEAFLHTRADDFIHAARHKAVNMQQAEILLQKSR